MSCCADSSGQRRRPRKLVVILVSCCVFLLVFCSCLLTALILIGRHTLYNHHDAKSFNISSAFSSNVIIDAARNGSLILSEPMPIKLYRLPRNVLPILYDIYLAPNLETGIFTGAVNITLNITQSSDKVILHSQDLAIKSVHLNTSDQRMIEVEEYKENEVFETLTVKTKTILAPGNYNLIVEFQGSLLNRIRGFYKSTYKMKNGTVR